MAALTFDKTELTNLEYSLDREMLATDRRGGYMSTTLVCCNTRKYHGLIVAPITMNDELQDFVLLSSLDETIVRDGQSFNLAIHKFKGETYEPKGHKYITDFEYTPTPTITYRVGDVVLKKELLWIHKRTQLMVRYTVTCSNPADEIVLQLRPFLAFRSSHALSRANIQANGTSYPIKGGVKCRLYEGFPWLNMQTSNTEAEFVPAPDWYYDFEYSQELERGYEGHEDLLTPGFFEMKLRCGQSVVFSASTEEIASAKTIESDYDVSVSRRTHKADFQSCMEHSARQFVVRRSNGDTEIVAGYPWYGVIGRQSLVALPGLTLGQGYVKDFKDVIDTLIRQDLEGRLPETYLTSRSVDTSLWCFRAMQMLEKEIGAEEVWTTYGEMMKMLLRKYTNNDNGVVSLHDNGLIWSWSDEKNLSWMDTSIDAPNAPRRNGYLVEVNALWYNAVCYMLDLAAKFKDKAFVAEWNWIPARAQATFQSLFWHSEGWLADFVNHETINTSIRLNMVAALGLDYKMLSEQQVAACLRTVQQHLLTPRGLRSLSPHDKLYIVNRSLVANKAAKNGTVWVWPLSLYVKACFDILGDAYLPDAKAILANFDDEIQNHGMGSISEFFDADPPFEARGAVSQAWSVGAVLEIAKMIDEYKLKTKARKTTATTATSKAAVKRSATSRTSAAKVAKTEKEAKKTTATPKRTASTKATSAKSTAPRKRTSKVL